MNLELEVTADKFNLVFLPRSLVSVTLGLWPEAFPTKPGQYSTNKYDRTKYNLTCCQILEGPVRSLNRELRNSHGSTTELLSCDLLNRRV